MYKYFHGSVLFLPCQGFQKLPQSSDSNDEQDDRDQLTSSDVLGVAVHHDTFTGNQHEEPEKDEEVCVCFYLKCCQLDNLAVFDIVFIQ